MAIFGVNIILSTLTFAAAHGGVETFTCNPSGHVNYVVGEG